MPGEERVMAGVEMWLLVAELAALAAAVLPSHLVRVRDMLLFCCYTGPRYFGWKALRPSNVEAWDGGRGLGLVQIKA